MSVKWYYMKRGWLGSKRIGPIPEPEFLHRIDSGEIRPETLIRCLSKTRGAWVFMRTITPAMERWNEKHPAT